jgi:glycerol-3-phosphate dehydrogenase
MPVADGPLPEDQDAVVIGGGSTVRRGLRSARGLGGALCDRSDLAFGASGNSSEMIHGGVRYLLQAPHVTETSCRDSGYIQQIAPHLLFRIPFLMPVRSGAQGRVLLELINAYFRAYDDYQPLKHSKPHCRLDASDMKRLEPGLARGGAPPDEYRCRACSNARSSTVRAPHDYGVGEA